MSAVTHRRLSRLHTVAVVPEPQNGSKIKSCAFGQAANEELRFNLGLLEAVQFLLLGPCNHIGSGFERMVWPLAVDQQRLPACPNVPVINDGLLVVKDEFAGPDVVEVLAQPADDLGQETGPEVRHQQSTGL